MINDTFTNQFIDSNNIIRKKTISNGPLMLTDRKTSETTLVRNINERHFLKRKIMRSSQNYSSVANHTSLRNSSHSR